ncbi:AMP-binding protein [Caulobacter sp. KR2-114]|uniref:AMP-binding protein n=1 Tax=Caulobacter sp. KR2-114 TaxID=3400912 RepID=UPI003C12242F
MSATLADLLSLGLASSPNAVALRASDKSWTFTELDGFANAIALRLRTQYRVSPGDRVVVLTEKSPAIVATALAAWRLGAIYAPVDSENPVDRLGYILDRLEPSVVVSSARVLARPALARFRGASLAYENLPNVDSERVEPRVEPHDLAAIVHTSGSTGMPKGVMLSHASIVSYFHNHNNYLRFRFGDCTLNTAPFHFDLSLNDAVMPIYFGAAAMVVSDVLLQSRFFSLVQKNSITHVLAASSMLRLVSRKIEDVDKIAGSHLRLLATGAEVCPPKLINEWLTRVPGLRILYGYGPTECNSSSLTHEVTSPDLGRVQPYPIGKPFDGVSAHLLDARGHAIADQVATGVLALGGPQLMCGYWRDPEATAAAFVQLPDGPHYVTGDLCRRDEAGDYHFQGRSDTQVKIRGRRMDINEVRDALHRIGIVQHAVVGLVGNEDDPRLAALLQLDEPTEAHIAEVRGELARWAPPYMTPTYLFAASRLPATGSGKLNEAEALRHVRMNVEADPYRRDAVIHIAVSGAFNG